MIPMPFKTLLIIALWLVLNGVSVGQGILALAVGIAAPLLSAKLTPERARFRRPLLALKLTFVVLYDIVLANIDVARRILGPEAAIHPAYFWYPLEVKSAHGIAVLASLITLTPGTLTADVTPDRKYLLVHAFHLDDEAATIKQIRTRFEAPLKEILL